MAQVLNCSHVNNDSVAGSTNSPYQGNKRWSKISGEKCGKQGSGEIRGMEVHSARPNWAGVPDGEQGEEFQLKEGESAAPGISPQFHSFRTNAQLSHCSTTEHQFDGEFLTNGRNPFNVRSSKMNAQNLRIFPEPLSKSDSSGGLNLAFIGNCTDSLQWEFFK